MAVEARPNVAPAEWPRRVLLVHNLLVEQGGAELVFLKEIELLRRHGFEVFAAGFGNEDAGDDSGPTRQIAEPRSWVLRKLFKFTFYPRGYRRLRRYVHRANPDVVHLHMATKYPLTILLALRGFPVVQTVHSNGMFCPTGWLVHADDREPCEGGAGWKCVRHRCVAAHALPLHLALERSWHAAAKRVVTHFAPPSRHLAEYLKRFGFPRVTRVPNFSPVAPPESVASPAHSETILYAGVLTAQKGVEFLIRAMPEILARRPTASLVVVGGGAAAAEIQELAASLGLGDAVRFTGRIPNRELAAYYGRARVCVVPSLWMENSPLVVYEAMLAGRPLVGTNRGGIPDLIESGRCGFVVEAQDPGALAEKVIRLLEDPALAEQLGANGRRYALEALSEDAFLSSLGGVWRDARDAFGAAAEARRPL